MLTRISDSLMTVQNGRCASPGAARQESVLIRQPRGATVNRLGGREVSIAAYRPRGPGFESRVEQFSKIVFSLYKFQIVSRLLGKENPTRKTLSDTGFL